MNKDDVKAMLADAHGYSAEQIIALLNTPMEIPKGNPGRKYYRNRLLKITESHAEPSLEGKSVLAHFQE